MKVIIINGGGGVTEILRIALEREGYSTGAVDTSEDDRESFGAEMIHHCAIELVQGASIACFGKSDKDAWTDHFTALHAAAVIAGCAFSVVELADQCDLMLNLRKERFPDEN